MISKLVFETMNCTATINSYESLPTRNSPNILMSNPPIDDSSKYETDSSYDFMTLKKMNKKLRGQDKK